MGTSNEGDVHFWHHAEFFLEWEMFQTKLQENIKTRISCSVTFLPPLPAPFFPKSCRLKGTVENCCTASQATDNNTVYALCMLDNSGCRHTQNMYYLLLYHGNNGYMKVPQCHVIRSMPALFYFLSSTARVGLGLLKLRFS
jgi:hypothetical protein